LPLFVARIVTGVFFFHSGSLKNRWYAWPSSHILFAVYTFLLFTFPPRLCSFFQPCAFLQCSCIFCTAATTCLYYSPSLPFPAHRKVGQNQRSFKRLVKDYREYCCEGCLDLSRILYVCVVVSIWCKSYDMYLRSPPACYACYLPYAVT
jgi:hypothetical protein